jgi:hypothetical protein
VHACCIPTHIAFRASAGSGSLKAIKTAAGLPDGDSNVLPRTLFTDAQALENSDEVVIPIALGL